uniref:DNA_mis_repair domain-containing protein n=1 Tax=Macrostomum lignano TaxID=282301 RepID=A0A1I8HIL6_9PLAT
MSEQQAPDSLPRIQRLDETVVNRIAAGEVIQRPFNAVKELLENSIDAGSTLVQIIARDGGNKLLQIIDNGCGIRFDDMPIVCERFTTSKLAAFTDLRSLNTHGFRGEALASISHVAHVSIVSKTAEAECAYRGEYFEGKLKASVKYVPGNQGTTITAEDLFFNVPIRRRTLKSATEEFKKIVEVVSLYSLHYPRVGMSVRKAGSDGLTALKTPADSTVAANIRLMVGAEAADALIHVNHEDKQLEFSLDAYVTGPSFAGRKTQLVLFINHRLVESARLRRAMESAFTEALPRGAQPFAYVSLQIAPHNVDVNVHPTKHEVFFLHQDAIADAKRPKLGADSGEAAIAAPSPGQHRRVMRLQCVFRMQRSVEAQADAELCAQFRKLVFVGCIDRRLALAQCDCDLLLLNMQLLSEKYFYQVMCRDFGNFEVLALSEPAPVRRLLTALLSSPAYRTLAGPDCSTAGAEQLIERFLTVLQSRSMMLLDYFSMEIDSDGNVLSLPLLLKKFQPDLDYLGVYLLRLATKVDWNTESACFETFCRETAKFYALKAPFPGAAAPEPGAEDDAAPHSTQASQASTARRDPIERSVELALFPSMRAQFKPDTDCRNSRAMGKLVSLQDMYRVFERC